MKPAPAIIGTCIYLALWMGCSVAPKAISPASQPADTVQAGMLNLVARFEAAVEKMSVQTTALTKATLDASPVFAAAGASASSQEQATKQSGGFLQIVSQTTNGKTPVIMLGLVAMLLAWNAPARWPFHNRHSRRGRSPPAS